jgi:histidinol phosphatase-like enzyme (inositol monophosphatase family)
MASERLVDTTLLAFAHKLADSAGSAIRPYFRHAISVTNKAGQQLFDPVTEADRAAEKAMRGLILAEYPAHGICGEEFADKAVEGPYQWVLDPIDGTRSFILGLPTWGTLIGLTCEGETVLGMMDQPYTGERFWSTGGEAYFREASGSEHVMRTRECPVLGDAIMTATAPDMFAPGFETERFQALAGRVRMMRFGGDCYLYCLLAMGFVDLVVEASLKTFDIAAHIPIIRAAGGVVTAWDGGDPLPGGRILAAGDPGLHAEALKVLAGKPGA